MDSTERICKAILAVRSTIGSPTCADADAMAMARVMFGYLLDWMVDADER